MPDRKANNGMKLFAALIILILGSAVGLIASNVLIEQTDLTIAAIIGLAATAAATAAVIVSALATKVVIHYNKPAIASDAETPKPAAVASKPSTIEMIMRRILQKPPASGAPEAHKARTNQRYGWRKVLNTQPSFGLGEPVDVMGDNPNNHSGSGDNPGYHM